MNRGTGPASNKFWKYIGSECHKLTVGNGAGMVPLNELKDYEGAFTPDEIAEITAIYAPKEKKDAPAPNAKRGPGRPRKVSEPVDTAGEVPEDGAE